MSMRKDDGVTFGLAAVALLAALGSRYGWLGAGAGALIGHSLVNGIGGKKDKDLPRQHTGTPARLLAEARTNDVVCHRCGKSNAADSMLCIYCGSRVTPKK